MSTAQIRFFSLWRREISRFMKIKKQTLGGPLLETFLYITVFGAALGSRIKELHGIEYVLFVIPGLVMMSWATNAFTNNSSSILQQKFQGAIHDQLCGRIAFIADGQIAAQVTSEDLAARYDVANLEDAYLALVGRNELSRSHIESDVV